MVYYVVIKKLQNKTFFSVTSGVFGVSRELCDCDKSGDPSISVNSTSFDDSGWSGDCDDSGESGDSCHLSH